MGRIEEFELDAHRAQLRSDIGRLVDKYRAIFGWDVPEVDEGLSERLIVTAMRQALDDLEQREVPGRSAPAATPVPASKMLAEQQSEFTAEGSPPPGMVSTSLPR